MSRAINRLVAAKMTFGFKALFCKAPGLLKRANLAFINAKHALKSLIIIIIIIKIRKFTTVQSRARYGGTSLDICLQRYCLMSDREMPVAGGAVVAINAAATLRFLALKMCGGESPGSE